MEQHWIIMEKLGNVIVLMVQIIIYFVAPHNYLTILMNGVFAVGLNQIIHIMELYFAIELLLILPELQLYITIHLLL